MKVRYDPEADILYILVKEGRVEDTVEIAEDIFIEYGEDNEVMGIEIWQARSNIIPPLADYLKEVISLSKAVS